MIDIAQSISNGRAASELNFSLVKESANALSLKVCCGNSVAFLKLFDEGPQGAMPFEREKVALCAFRQTGLVPKIIGFNVPHRFLLVEWVDSPQSSKTLFGYRPETLARKLGQWLARFDSSAPWQAECGNWFGYFSRFGQGVDLSQLKSMRATLSQIPLYGRSLARGDAALHNFVMDEKRRLLGCDFENAMMRPRGWDYIQMHNALIQRFPDDAASVISGLSDGFSANHKGALMVDELNRIARYLFCARATLSGAVSRRSS